jgi:hypothetical protein
MAQPLGERFVEALADKDAAGLKAVLRPDVDFRAMTPGKFWESDDVDVIVDETILGKWFDPDERITEVLALDTDRVGSRDRVGYRLHVERPDGAFVVEQQAYYETQDDKISWIRIMCSGYLPLT